MMASKTEQISIQKYYSIMKLNRILLAAAIAVPAVAQAQAQQPQTPELEFTIVKENPITSVKNQNSSGTCWCFSAISFLESEAIRINNIKDKNLYPDFSEMFVVSHSYQDRADKYIRLDGNLTFGAGSECEDVIHIMRDYGLVPNSVMTGLNYGTTLPVHGEVDAAALAYVQAIQKNPNRSLSTAWKNGFKGIMDAYFGECPEEFEYNGKKYTPASYRDSYKLNPDDYVTLTSFTHHPFYTQFAIEVCDNWRSDMAYNVPIDEFWDAIYYAIEHGYTTTWGGDVSETGFTRTGSALLLDTSAPAAAGSDQERWVGSDRTQGAAARPAGAPKEKVVTQESRQKDFDNKATTDDHGMHAFGIAKDQYGNKYLMIKNSWGETGKYNGIWYMSEAFTRGKAIDFMVHKDGLPKALKDKLGIK